MPSIIKIQTPYDKDLLNSFRMLTKDYSKGIERKISKASNQEEISFLVKERSKIIIESVDEGDNDLRS